MASVFRLAYEAQRLRPSADADDADAGGCCGSATIVTVAVAVAAAVIEVVVEFVELITGIFF